MSANDTSPQCISEAKSSGFHVTADSYDTVLSSLIAESESGTPKIMLTRERETYFVEIDDYSGISIETREAIEADLLASDDCITAVFGPFPNGCYIVETNVGADPRKLMDAVIRRLAAESVISDQNKEELDNE